MTWKVLWLASAFLASSETHILNYMDLIPNWLNVTFIFLPKALSPSLLSSHSFLGGSPESSYFFKKNMAIMSSKSSSPTHQGTPICWLSFQFMFDFNCDFNKSIPTYCLNYLLDFCSILEQALLREICIYPKYWARSLICCRQALTVYHF